MGADTAGQRVEERWSRREKPGLVRRERTPRPHPFLGRVGSLLLKTYLGLVYTRCSAPSLLRTAIIIQGNETLLFGPLAERKKCLFWELRRVVCDE